MEDELLMASIIRMGGVRIFRPSECRVFIRFIPKRKYQLMFKVLLYTGMRYIEVQRLYRHPQWFDGNFIHLPDYAQRKAKRKQKERWVRLNPVGKEIVNSFLEIDRNLPDYKTWIENLERWAKFANLSTEGLSPKTTRKTWESWLVFYYEKYIVRILQSQGHTMTVSLEHYVNLPFTRQDEEAMGEFVGGWI